MLQPHLQPLLGQPFYVENRAGAAGRIGTDAVAKAEPDGQTLLMTTESSLVIAPHMGVPMSYDPLKDFAPISLLTRNTVILVVHPSVPANTLQEYMALRAQQARAAVLCLLGRRRAQPSRRRDLQADDLPRHRARAVSRHRRRHPGGHLQPGRRHVGLPRRTDPPHPRRLAEGAGRRRQGAFADPARRADGRGVRRARLRGGLLDRAGWRPPPRRGR